MPMRQADAIAAAERTSVEDDVEPLQQNAPSAVAPSRRSRTLRRAVRGLRRDHVGRQAVQRKGL